jgi:hypothetical protein
VCRFVRSGDTATTFEIADPEKVSCLLDQKFNLRLESSNRFGLEERSVDQLPEFP